MDIDEIIKQRNYPNLNKCIVAVIGMGYVGLPLAVEFAKKKECHTSKNLLLRDVIGFDINPQRIDELKSGFDVTGEISKEELLKVDFLDLTNDIDSIARADVFLVTVPTPIDEFKKPNLKALEKASSTVGKAIKIRTKKYNIKKSLPVIIFESTVYPGTTEEICIPIIENELGCNSANSSNEEKYIYGYSPERINPGDKKHTLVNIKKVTSGNNIYASKWIEHFYGSIIKAGIYSAQSIKVAEAAKIIENTQRDINIALVNELSIIFKLMNIDTLDILNAAATKWNFIDYKPGLVGGHCIGVDPYYLTYKAGLLGYSPEIILAGRKINDGMGKWIAEQIVLEMLKKELIIKESNILILGFTFKENCPDIRNTKVIDIVNNLIAYQANLEIVDPKANSIEAKKVYDINLSKEIPKNKKFDVIVSAVRHNEFQKLTKKSWINLSKDDGLYFDIKGIIPRELKPIRI